MATMLRYCGEKRKFYLLLLTRFKIRKKNDLLYFYEHAANKPDGKYVKYWWIHFFVLNGTFFHAI